MRVVVVGGGIAGLNAALKLSAQHHKVTLFDNRSRVGGRIYTHRHPQYEIGAARFHQGHVLLNRLIQHYNLTAIPLPRKKEFYSSSCLKYEPKAVAWFDDRIRDVLRASSSFKKERLQAMTFRELCVKVIQESDTQKLIAIFGYRCEFELMNAYDACRTFSEDFSGNAAFSVLSEGLSTLCEKMKQDILRRGGVVLTKHKVDDVARAAGGAIHVVSGSVTCSCDRVVFAVKPHQLSRFSILEPVRPCFDSVTAGALLRVYAQFPVNEKGPWFAGMSRTTTDSFLRHIIPISVETGLIMLSYTDGEDVNFFLRNGKLRQDTQERVMAECRRLFGQRIPAPTFFEAHYWSEGCHYWKPGYDSERVKRSLIRPLEDVFICGEGFSTRQAWVEGALETSELVLDRFR